MPRYSFQVRTGGATIRYGAALDFDDLAQALAVSKVTMAGQALLDARATINMVGSALEIVDEAGAAVASVPIGEEISKH